MPIDDPLKAAILLPLILVVTVCAITDVSTHRIPNIVLFPALALAFLINSLLAGFPGFFESVLGLVFGMAVLFPLYFVGGTSAGDVKLLGVVGAYLGGSAAITAGIATLVIGGVLGIVFIAWRVIEPILMTHVEQLLRGFGTTEPSLIRATATQDNTKTAAFPYAPAIACGTFFTLWHLGYFSQVTG
jgi:prepilin peptidase CpaA